MMNCNNDELTNSAMEREEVMLRDYYLRHSEELKPDVDAGFEEFKEQHFRKGRAGVVKSLYWVAACIAASVMIMVYVGHKDGREAQPVATDVASEFVAYERNVSAVREITVTSGGITKVVKSTNLDYSAQKSNVSAEMQTVRTPYGTTAEVTLADGTEIILNAGGILTFPATFTGGERRVTLRGEAYFKVAGDSAHPFIVDAGNMETRVTGTEFNVRAYGAADAVVALVEGSVDVSTSSDKKHLSPGEGALITANGMLRIENIDADAVRAWTSGEFYFDNEEMLVIAREIGRWYGINVVFNNMRHAHTKVFFSASRYETLADIVAIINSFDNVKMQLEKDKIVVN